MVLLYLICLDVSTIHKGNYHKPLLHAIATVESNFNTKAVSKKGAIGINQIRYSVWSKELKKNKIISNRKDLFNPQINMRASHYILVKYGLYKLPLKDVLYRYSGRDKNYAMKVMKEME